jgi:hypothetical protein
VAKLGSTKANDPKRSNKTSTSEVSASEVK